MELTVKFKLDDSWEAYYPNDEERLKALIKPMLEGVKFKIIKDKFVQISEFLPSTKNQYIDELVLVCVKNKNKEGGILLWDVAAFDGESWSKRYNTWEDIIGWKPIQ